jgi:hypothetical protein
MGHIYRRLLWLVNGQIWLDLWLLRLDLWLLRLDLWLLRLDLWLIALQVSENKRKFHPELIELIEQEGAARFFINILDGFDA